MDKETLLETLKMLCSTPVPGYISIDLATGEKQVGSPELGKAMTLIDKVWKAYQKKDNESKKASIEPMEEVKEQKNGS